MVQVEKVLIGVPLAGRATSVLRSTTGATRGDSTIVTEAVLGEPRTALLGLDSDSPKVTLLLSLWSSMATVKFSWVWPGRKVSVWLLMPVKSVPATAVPPDVEYLTVTVAVALAGESRTLTTRS